MTLSGDKNRVKMHFVIKMMPKIPLDRNWVCIAPSKVICYFIFNMFYAFPVTFTDFKGLKYSFSDESCLQIMHFHKHLAKNSPELLLDQHCSIIKHGLLHLNYLDCFYNDICPCLQIMDFRAYSVRNNPGLLLDQHCSIVTHGLIHPNYLYSLDNNICPF